LVLSKSTFATELGASLNPGCRELLDKLVDAWLLKKFPTNYETRRFIAVSTTAKH
jgi:hypothetical protein